MPAPGVPRHPRQGDPSLRAAPGRGPRPATLALIDISHRLRPRDYTIAALLEDHITLSTGQLAAVLFGSETRSRHRLYELRRLGFVDRFRHTWPAAPGPVCWVPGLLGARYTALTRDEPPPSGVTLRERQDRVCASPTLRHLLAVNEFFIGLLARARTEPGAALTRWWSERATAGVFGQRIHPDGHGVWADGHGETGFFLELDRGTEQISRLLAKLDAYRRLRAAGGPAYPVLFVLPGAVRERNLHLRLAENGAPGLTVATTVARPGLDGAGPVWQVAGGGARMRLSQLPSSHGEPGPLTPGPAVLTDDPLWLLGPAGQAA